MTTRKTGHERIRERRQQEQQKFREGLATLSDEQLLLQAAHAYQMVELAGWSQTAIYGEEIDKRQLQHPPRYVLTNEMLDAL
jgi:hypothetical protein